ncbi:MAG: clostripain-related cysteine peptidase [Spirochaetia bacterium]
MTKKSKAAGLSLLLLFLLLTLSCELFVKKYTVTVTVTPESGGEFILTPGEASYKAGSVVAVTAAPLPGYRFSRYTGDLTGIDPESSFVIEKDMMITVEFISQNSLTVTSEGEGSVTQTVIEQSKNLYDTGSVVELEAVPQEGYKFDSWTGDLTGSDNPIRVTVDKDLEITAVFTESSKWTFLIYLDGDNNLEAAGLEDMNELEGTDLTGTGINVIVLLDRVPGYSTADGDWTDTRLFRVEYDPQGIDTVIRSTRLASSELGLSASGSDDELDMGNPETLINFIDFGQSEYPADNYFLVLWNHGGGWRDTFGSLPDSGDAPSGKISGISAPPPSRAVCWDETSSNTCLYTAEVGDAVSGKGIDVIGFDACLMGMIEVAYELRNDCAYMIGSQELEPGDGWEYNLLLEKFTAGDMTAPDLLSAVVEAYAQHYSAYADCTLSGIDLSKIDPFMTAYDAFCDTLYGAITSADIQTNVQNALWDAEYFWDADGGDHNVDIWSFAHVIQTDYDYADTEAAAVKTAIEDMVTAEWHNTGHPGAKGLNIHNIYVFSDYSLGYWKSYTSGYPSPYPVSFVDNSGWPGTYDPGSGTITGPGLIYRIWFESF